MARLSMSVHGLFYLQGRVVDLVEGAVFEATAEEWVPIIHGLEVFQDVQHVFQPLSPNESPESGAKLPIGVARAPTVREVAKTAIGEV